MDGVSASAFGICVLAVVKQVIFMQEVFDARRKDAYPNFPCGLDEGDRAEVMEGDVVWFFGDGTE
jgi:hypothetical protein